MEKNTLYLILLLSLFLGCKRSSPSEINNSSAIPLKLITSYKLDISEPSGLTFNKKNNSLYTVSDGNSTVYQIDFMGKIISSLTVESSDLEGIAFTSNQDTMYVAEETRQLVTNYTGNRKINSFAVKVATNIKNALEGTTIDNKDTVFVLNEKTPCMLLKFFRNKEVFRKEFNYSIDCSDIYFDESQNCLWMVSDESRSVIKMTKNGDKIAEYSVPFLKGEGITVTNDKIYIVTDDTAMMYVFEKPK